LESRLPSDPNIGKDWSALPFGTVKAARNGGPSIITAQTECIECGRAMYACNPVLENLCEEDEYLLRSALWDRRAELAKRQRERPPNPLRESEEPIRAFWPREER
jgi:hypothetical protein